MKSLTRHIPNFITLCSLLSGTVGIVAVFQWDVRYGAYFIWVGALLDFLDGFFARLLGAYSEIGKELDSLADMVTFGLLPAFMMFGILSAFPHVHPYLPYMSFIIPVLSALRLAKFNIDIRQKEDFIGLPTPANALLLSGIPFMTDIDFLHFTGSPVFISLTLLIGSLLMISPIRFVSLKFKNLKTGDNLHRLAIIIAALLFLILFNIKGVTPALVSYIIISLLANLFAKRKAESFN